MSESLRGMDAKTTARDKIPTFEMYCYRRLLQRNWTQKVTNGEIRKRQNIKKDLTQAVMRRKLGLFGQVYKMENIKKIKDVMMEETGHSCACQVPTKTHFLYQSISKNHSSMQWKLDTIH